MAKKSVWTYGVSPNPRSWSEAGQVLKNMLHKPKPNGKDQEAIELIKQMKKEILEQMKNG